MESAIISVSEISKIYDNGTEALSSVSFDVRENEIFGIIGVNGAGKTTLIRILTTMLRPTSGSCSIDGLNPIDYPEKVRSLVGVLPQETGLYSEFSIYENLEFIAKMQGVPKHEIRSRIEKITAMLGIRDRLDTRVDHLSGGLKQRTMIARTLIGNPKVLLLDEPTTGLDVLVSRKVRQLIKQLSKDVTILLATHNMHEAYQLCDRVAIIKDGVIQLVDTPYNILVNHRKSEEEDFEDVIARLLGIDEMEELE